ncbi:MAG: hypothetical protein ACM3JG_19060 [Thiohalocapsa sp.]
MVKAAIGGAATSGTATNGATGTDGSVPVQPLAAAPSEPPATVDSTYREAGGGMLRHPESRPPEEERIRADRLHRHADAPARAAGLHPPTNGEMSRGEMSRGEASRTLHLSLGGAGNGGRQHPEVALTQAPPLLPHSHGDGEPAQAPGNGGNGGNGATAAGAGHHNGNGDWRHHDGAPHRNGARDGYGDAPFEGPREGPREGNGNGSGRKHGGGTFIDHQLRARVDGDIAAFLAAFDAALQQDTQESRALLREATDRLLRAGARTRIELERLEARVPLTPRDGGSRGEAGWRQR